MQVQAVASPKHSVLFRGACKDTCTAWSKTNISRMLKAEQVDAMRTAMLDGTAESISEFFVHMAQNPYSNLALSSGFDDAMALRLAGLMMNSFLIPFVDRRQAGDLLDLVAVREAMAAWIDEGLLPENSASNSDIGNITKLVTFPEQRVSLCACFAAPIQFSILALGVEDSQ